MPFFDPITRSLEPSVSATAISRSSSSTSIAMMPAVRGFENSDKVGLLDGAVPRAHHDEALAFLGRELLHLQQRRQLLALGHVHEIRDGLALAAPADFRHVVDAQPVASSAVREDQDVGVRVGDEEVRDDILFARLHADQALAATPLLPVRVERGALDVARVRRGDDDVFVGDEILDPELAALFDEVRAPLVAVLRANLLQLVDDNPDR